MRAYGKQALQDTLDAFCHSITWYAYVDFHIIFWVLQYFLSSTNWSRISGICNFLHSGFSVARWRNTGASVWCKFNFISKSNILTIISTSSYLVTILFEKIWYSPGFGKPLPKKYRTILANCKVVIPFHVWFVKPLIDLPSCFSIQEIKWRERFCSIPIIEMRRTTACFKFSPAIFFFAYIPKTPFF